MGLINYHTHTPLCSHATGTTEEYVKSAIEKNLSELGFSDHAPLPEEMRKGITMAPEELEQYMACILEYREKYHDRISIKLGFEVDYPLQHTFDMKYYNDPRIDYLMGSCHFIESWPFDQDPYRDEYRNRDIDAAYAAYYTIVESMAKTGLFDIIGHFDLIKKFGFRPVKNFSGQVEIIAGILSVKGTAVEINTSGLLKPVGEMYPSDEIIKILFEKNVPVTTGSDCHSPDLIDYMLREAVVKLKKAGYRKISGFEKRKRYDIDIDEI